MAQPLVLAEGLCKRFGDLDALRGLDLVVTQGTVCGLLGPNGAGKTTAIRVLATLLAPDGGRATVAGHDVVANADQVRRLIGLAGQHAALDEKLTGYENLLMFGRLYHIGERAARRRAAELLERFDLADARNRLVRHYSGGMRRRLDLITSLIVAPPLLFLDEPTTGLDPRSRNEIWSTVRDLVTAGTTVLLTTQYLDEADHLADDIAVVDHGRVIAAGRPDQLKSAIGNRIVVNVSEAAELSAAREVLSRLAGGTEINDEGADAESTGGEYRLSVVTGSNVRVPDVVRALDAGGVAATDVTMHRPTLDEVFLRLTGHQAGGTDQESAELAGSSSR